VFKALKASVAISNLIRASTGSQWTLSAVEVFTSALYKCTFTYLLTNGVSLEWMSNIDETALYVDEI